MIQEKDIIIINLNDSFLANIQTLRDNHPKRMASSHRCNNLRGFRQQAASTYFRVFKLETQ